MEDRIPIKPPIIKPIANSEARPLFSIMIPSYNCTRYLTTTLTSVLCQDPGPLNMQIEVIDDCSTDGDVKLLVDEIGKGRIGFY